MLSTITNRLLMLQRWQILAWGAATLLLGLAVITALAMIGYVFLPVWVAAILHLGLMVGGGYWLATFFARIYIVRTFLEVLSAQLGRDDA